MKGLPPGVVRLLPLMVAASLVACAGGAPATAPQAPAAAVASVAPAPQASAATGSRPAAAPPPAVAASIAKSLTRAARPIPDPAVGKSFKASQYWDYELGTPFEVEDTTITGLGDADKDGRVETKIVSDVKLPNQKTQAKLLRLGKYALTQADDDAFAEEAEDEDTYAEDEGDGDEDGVDPDDDAGDDDAGDEDADTDASGTDVAGDDEDDDATTGSDDDGQAGADDEDFDFDDWETEIDAAEVDEEISEDEDDITWEDDWVVDDGDGIWDEDAEAVYEEEFSEDEEDTFLTAPHKCEMTVHDAPLMSNQEDLITVTDTETGETLTVTYDQEWVRFTLKTSGGEGTVELLPDGTYLADGTPRRDADAVAAYLRERPFFRVLSRHTLGLLASRLGRLPEAPSRTPMCCNCDNGGPSYRLAGADASGHDPEIHQDARRAFAIVNALVGSASE